MPRTKEQFAELREKKRDIILKTAIRLFAQKGYNNTSINDIAKTAKISTGLTYHYFQSKQKILEAIIEQWLSVAGTILNELESKNKDPLQKIRDIVENVFDNLMTNEELWKLYISFLVQPGVLKKIKKFAMARSQKYWDALEEVFAELGFKDPHIEVKFLDVFIDGVWLNNFIEEGEFPLEEMKEFLLQRYSEESIQLLKNSK